MTQDSRNGIKLNISPFKKCLEKLHRKLAHAYVGINEWHTFCQFFLMLVSKDKY